MALNEFQVTVLKLCATVRLTRGERYVAGGVALNSLLQAPRLSRDIDMFHDSSDALSVSWTEDRRMLETKGFGVSVLREAPSFVEALVNHGAASTVVQWTVDSAFRFFPLILDDTIGLTLHPFDLATNKVLALVGRREVRDWIDTITCHQRLQPYGYLVWAACGKDPGYNPRLLIEISKRVRFNQMEIDTLSFEGTPPNASECAMEWHRALDDAESIIEALPFSEVGTCVVDAKGRLFSGNAQSIERAIKNNQISFHTGALGGAWPTIIR